MQAVVSNADVVFSLAGKVSHIESMTDPVADLEHNVRAPLVTLEAVRARRPETTVVFASTRQVYGTPEYVPVDERHPLRPVDVNGIHKVAAEQLHALYARVYGLRTVNIRLTNVYGPRQVIGHDRHGFIGWFVRLALEDRAMTVFGDGAQTRDYVYVDDVVDAFVRATEKGGGLMMNIGTGLETSVRELYDAMAELTGYPQPPNLAPPRAGELARSALDPGRAAIQLGWKPWTQLGDGLGLTIDWFRSHA